MREPHELNDPPDGSGATFEARLRNIRPPAPRLDRDRLMFLAGQRSVAKPTTPARRPHLWPLVAVASWAACAVLAGLLVTRPPRIVVETRVVERIVKVPAEQTPPPKNASMLVTEFLPATGSSSPDPDPLSLVPLDEPLTILSSRPAYRRLREPLTIAQAPSAPAVEVAPSPPPSYGDLRGELLPAQPTDPAAGLFRWF